MSTATETIEGLVQKEYKYGFYTDVEADSAPPGLNEDIVRLISAKKNEPQFMLDWLRKAVHNHPDLVKKYLGMVVPYTDNFFASLNSAVFSDGSFCFIPKGVRCPMELSTYFRINAANTGQFERTLIIAEEGSSVSYLEG